MKQERTLKQISITLDNVANQCKNMLDFLHDTLQEQPENETYFKLMDYITSSVHDVQEKIKTL